MNFLISKPLTTILLFLFCVILPRISSTISIPNFDLSSSPLHPPATGFTITGNAQGDYLGISVSTAGDFNGDGYDDIIVGAHQKDQGVAYLIYGGKSFSLSDLDLTVLTLDPKTTGFTVTGKVSGSCFGYSVSTAGDIDNDGYDDIIIGAYCQESNRGAAYVIYGGPISTRQDIDLSSPLDPTKIGFSIRGYGSGNRFGYSVNTAGDINKDGYDDIIIGATGKDLNKGTTYVIYGGERSSFANIELSTTPPNPATTGFSIVGSSSSARFGYSVSSAGDVNGDGYDDIIAGALLSTYQGRAYVLYGRKKSQSKDIDLATETLDPATTGFTITGNDLGDFFACSVSTAGDINNDGYADIIIGAKGKYSNQGAAYVIYGKKISDLSHLDLSLTTLDPLATGFKIVGDGDSEGLGSSVGLTGDLNGDGYSDIIIGAPNRAYQQGTEYVLYGGKTSSFSNINLGSKALDPSTTGLTVRGGAPLASFGTSVSTAGDVNGDGFDDIIIGASDFDVSQGAVYVIHSGCVSTPGSPLCIERQFCQACNQGYKLTNPKCKSCPLHCQDFSSPKSCRTCDQGYVLSNSLCILSPPPEIALQKASVIISTIGSIISLGKSIFLVSGLISKVVQYTRYMDLIVSDKLAEIYYNWDTDLFSLGFPGSLSHLIQYKSMPTLFARYEIDPAFLANFWSNLIVISAGLCVFIVSTVLKKFTDQAKIQGWPQSFFNKLIITSQNFIMVQTYGCLDDVLFYFILDVKANPGDTAFSRVSLFFAVVFLCIGASLVYLNISIIKRYQNKKNQGVAKELETFVEKNKHFELFYSDFSDADSWSHSFLAFLVIRSILSTLIIGLLYRTSLLQSTLLTIMDAAILLFLLFKKPLTENRTKLAQYFFEILALLVHICTFILSLQRNQDDYSGNLKRKTSTAIINLNTTILAGGLAFMLFEICLTIHEKIKAWKMKRNQHQAKALPSTSEERSSVIQEAQRSGISQRQDFIRVSSQKSVDLSERCIERINWPAQNLNSSMNADQSLTRQRDRDSEQIFINRRRKYLRNIKPKQRQINLKDML